jgi:hypothetical protein
MIGQEEAASLTDIPNIQQKGTRLGNWLTREQAKELLAVTVWDAGDNRMGFLAPTGYFPFVSGLSLSQV